MSFVGTVAAGLERHPRSVENENHLAMRRKRSIALTLLESTLLAKCLLVRGTCLLRCAHALICATLQSLMQGWALILAAVFEDVAHDFILGCAGSNHGA